MCYFQPNLFPKYKVHMGVVADGSLFATVKFLKLPLWGPKVRFKKNKKNNALGLFKRKKWDNFEFVINSKAKYWIVIGTETLMCLHYCRVKLNAFALTVAAEMLGVFMVSTHPTPRLMKTLCVNVEIIQSQTLVWNLGMTQPLGKNNINIPLLCDLHIVDVKAVPGWSFVSKQLWMWPKHEDLTEIYASKIYLMKQKFVAFIFSLRVSEADTSTAQKKTSTPLLL